MDQIYSFLKKEPLVKFQRRCFLVNITKFLRTSFLKNMCKRLFLHIVFNGNVEQHLLAKLDEMGQDIIVLYLSVSIWCYCISDSNRKRQQSNYEIKVSTISWVGKCFISGNKLRFLIQAMNGNQKFLYAK